MVVGVRKNMMLLFENKLSYIFCVVGAGVTNAEWAWWFVKLNQRCWLACWYTCAWYFTMCFVKFESTVVTFDSGVVGLEINVWHCFRKCEKLVFVPLLKFSATSQTLSLRHDNIMFNYTWNYFIIIYIYYYHTYIMQISIYVINNMPERGRNLTADACMGRTQLSPCIISVLQVLGQSVPTGMQCQHDIFFMLSHLYSDFLRKCT